MNRVDRIARKIIGQVDTLGMDPLAMDVARFCLNNPNPNDGDFHEWAESKGYDVDEAEGAGYRIAQIAVSFMFGGRANEKGVTVDDVDPVELAMGIDIEKEHTPNIQMATRIALDHLAEIENYYTRLKKMEEEAGV